MSLVANKVGRAHQGGCREACMCGMEGVVGSGGLLTPTLSLRFCHFS